MKKKILSVLLSLTMVLGTGMTAFASTTPPPSAGNGKILLDTEVFPVVDDQGNKVYVTMYEYGNIESRSSFGSPDYPVGKERSFTFRISNNALGFPSFAAGTPLTSSMKKALAKAIEEKLGEKLAGSLIPGVNIVSWVLTAIALGNGLAGNNGFEISVDCKYSRTFIHSEGYYIYGWDVTNCSFGVY